MKINVPFLSLVVCLVMPPAAMPAIAASFDLTNASIADIDAAFDAHALTSEKLVQLYLKRIEAYDKQGPKINAVLTLNERALETARALDKERHERQQPRQDADEALRQLHRQGRPAGRPRRRAQGSLGAT